MALTLAAERSTPLRALLANVGLELLFRVPHSLTLSLPPPCAQEVFLASALLLQRLVADAPRALALSRMPEVLGKYEGVARLLALRLAQEQKYLLKLEGQKVGGGGVDEVGWAKHRSGFGGPFHYRHTGQ